jgi:RHS repeat-associated protein
VSNNQQDSEGVARMRRLIRLLIVLVLLVPSALAQMTTVVASSAAHDVLKQPTGVAVSAVTGVVYIADTMHDRILAARQSGEVQVLLQTALKQPCGVALDVAHARLYIADTGNDAVRALALDSGTLTTVATGLKQPHGIATDAAGDVYVADTGNSAIRVISPAGVISTLSGGVHEGFADGPVAQALFKQPAGIAVGADGAVYVADTMNHAIRKIEHGVVTTMAGTSHPGFVDGAATAAEFAQPGGVAVDESGTVYVADTLNHAIRKIAGGVVTTIAGNGKPGFADSQFNQPNGIAFAGALFIADTVNDALRAIYFAPAVSSVSPRRGPLAGGNAVHVYGSTFVPGVTTVSLGAASYVSSTELLVTVAAAAAGTVDVRVTTPGGTAVLPAAYTYLPPPTISSVTPAKLRSSGGQTLTIDGADVVDGGDTTVTIGGIATPATFVSSTRLLVIAPPHAAGSADVTVTTPGGTAHASVTYFDPPAIASFAPPSGRPGATVVIHGASFDPDPSGDQVLLGGTPATVLAATATDLTIAIPANASTDRLTVTTAGGTAVSTTDFIVVTYVSLAIAPSPVVLGIGTMQQLTATATRGDGSTADVTAQTTWSSSDATRVIVDASGRARGVASGSATVTATFSGLTATTTARVFSEPLPPDPATVAPPLPTSIATSFADAYSFLYTGPNPIQRGVSANAIDARFVGVLRGRVLDTSGQPLPGVHVTILGQPQFGYTLSRADGWYDLAVNAGTPTTLVFTLDGYLAVQRTVPTRWNRFAPVPDVAMTPLDPAVTTIDLTQPAMQVARGSISSDSDGQRRATLLFPSGTTATLMMPDGTTQPLTTLHVRATEYTVGRNGPKAMPAPLPPTSAYTYCAELSADEALAAGATSVTFSKPVAFYVDNFLAFPVGIRVPLGWYDRGAAVWRPLADAVVVKVLTTDGGIATVDSDGDGIADNAVGMSDDERRTLATLYAPGQTLWRSTVTHFTPFDLNQPVVLPGAIAPQEPDAEVDVQPNDSCRASGSILDCQGQALGEELPIAGTAYQLEYSSMRTPGRSSARVAGIRLTGDSVPPPVRSVELTIDVAGQHIEKSYTPAPNLKETFTWDGRDAYGRPIIGGQEAHITIGYNYPTTYVGVRSGPSGTFALTGATGVTLRSGRVLGLLTQDKGAILRPWDTRGIGLGGWMLDVHHQLDPGGNELLRGDGTKRSSNEIAGVINTVAGAPASSYPFGCFGFFGPATSLCLGSSSHVVFATNGGWYVGSGTYVVRINAAGFTERIAGNGNSSDTGDGGPALNASLSGPYGLALAADGTLYIGEPNANIIRRIDPNGVITRYAGDALRARGFSGDNGPAPSAKLDGPTDLAVGPDGSLYILDANNWRVRRVGNDGVITTIIGNGSSAEPAEGVAAATAPMGAVGGIAVGPDGSVYLAGGFDRIKRITPDGIVKTFARLGDACPKCATDPTVGGVSKIAVSSDGTVYVTGFVNLGTFFTPDQRFRIWRINPDSSSTIVAEGANGFSFLITDQFFGGDNGMATAAKYANPTALSVAPDGGLYLTDAGNRRIRRIAPLAARQNGPELLMASEDGGEVYAFDKDGRHLRTISATTGNTLASFTYDAAGRLTGITDTEGNRTTIEHDAAGNATAIVAPGGQRTTLQVDGNGWLATVADPAGNTTQLATSADGLLQTLTDARHSTHRFTFDSSGRLFQDTDPAGGVQTLTLGRNLNDYTVTRSTLLGRAFQYALETLTTGDQRRTMVSPSGTRTISILSPDRTTTTTSADGTVTTTKVAADPRFGIQAPMLVSATMKLPSGLTSSLTHTRSVTLGNPADVLSVTSVIDSLNVNGATFTARYNATTRQLVTTSAMNRTATLTYDAQGHVVKTEIPGLAASTFVYDARGRLTTMTSLARSTVFGWDDRNRLTSMTDPLQRTVSYTYDDDDRVISELLPNQTAIGFTYDENGNITSVTPASRPMHAFAYTPVDLAGSYTPPSVPNGGATTYAYNKDRQLTLVTRPDQTTIGFTYNGVGQLTQMATAADTYTYAYDATSGVLRSIATGANTLSFTYDGSFLSTITSTGPFTSVVGFTYDTDLRIASESVAGTAIPFGYDRDGLLTSAGFLSLTRNGQNGLLTGSTLSNVTDVYTYDSFGAPASYTASVSGTPIFAQTYARDDDGRITQKTEALYGTSTTFGYGYDEGGRLATVTRDGSPVASYAYDDNGNRLASGASYDAQDRMLTCNGATYAYTANGELQSKTDASGTTQYTYDALGNLRSVVLPNATRIDYVIDAMNRRVGKRVNGTLVRGWIYSDALHIVAETDDNGAIVSRFVYATRTNVPDYMIRGGATYRVIADHLGSPRLIVNAATGELAESIGYDEYGNVLTDSAPGFQPFGFAGGLYDPDTKLTRFGARDYDANVGRWTAKDPIGLAAADADLYTYAGDDPMNVVDSSGESGFLTIHSTGENGSSDNLTEGHSWITYTPDGGAETSYGTWGNHPEGQDNGLLVDEELTRHYGMGDATRTTWISDYEEKKLMQLVDRYRKQGEKGWSTSQTCATFASDAWYAATDERLDPNPIGALWDTPTGLRESIRKLNGGIGHHVVILGPVHVGVAQP